MKARSVSENSLFRRTTRKIQGEQMRFSPPCAIQVSRLAQDAKDCPVEETVKSRRAHRE